jgi:hypothetical protein
MTHEIHFKAPWSDDVKIVTGVATFLLLASSLVGAVVLPSATPTWARWLATAGPLLVLTGTLLFIVRGYVLRGGELLIERLAWRTHVKLDKLVSATIDPEALRKSIRILGSGGLFGFLGWFRNRKLGNYRAYATDQKRTVVLRLPGKVIVVSPDEPGKFLTELERLRHPTTGQE